MNNFNSLTLEDFNYELNNELIAQEPLEKRENCRLMCLNRTAKTIEHKHFYDILKKQCEEKGLGKDIAFYLEFFKYGCPPHGGFAIGVDRLTMLLLGLPSLKEEMFIFRGPSRLTP